MYIHIIKHRFNRKEIKSSRVLKTEKNGELELTGNLDFQLLSVQTRPALPAS